MYYVFGNVQNNVQNGCIKSNEEYLTTRPVTNLIIN
nr:MAG TPA: hypothetical protein [Caudoviricetes sp.]